MFRLVQFAECREGRFAEIIEGRSEAVVYARAARNIFATLESLDLDEPADPRYVDARLPVWRQEMQTLRTLSGKALVEAWHDMTLNEGGEHGPNKYRITYIPVEAVYDAP